MSEAEKSNAASLDDLLNQFRQSGADDAAVLERPAPEPAAPDPRQRLAEFHQLNQTVDGVRQWKAKTEEWLQPIIEREERAGRLEQRQTSVDSFRAANDIEHVKDAQIWAALSIEDDNDRNEAVAAVLETEREFRDARSRDDLRSAWSAVQGISYSGPPPVQFDPAKAARMSDQEWDKHKLEIIAQQRAEGRR